MKRTVAAIVLTLDQRERTLRCLASIASLNEPALAVVLWDNGSRDGTAEAVRSAFPEVLVHRHPTNLGVASGRNAGARLAIESLAPTYLLFLDNDMAVTPGFVQALLRPFAGDGKLGQTQAKLLLLDDPQRLNDGGGCRVRFWLGQTRPVGFGELDRGQYDRPAPCIACGGAMMVRTDVFEELGGFDSRFDPFGPEDLDFSLRLQKAGYRALYVPEALAFHQVSHTFGGGEYSEDYARYRSRHWFAFMRRHASATEKLGFFLIGAPLGALRILAREARRGNLGALRGLVRGWIDSWLSRSTS